MTSPSRDIGAYIKSGLSVVPQSAVTAGSSLDGSEITGTAFDRLSLTSEPYLSAKVVIPYTSALSAGETATIVANVQDSVASSAGWADYDDKDGSTANTANLSTAALSGTLEFDIDLSRAKQYVRIQLTPTISSTATDTVTVGGGVFIFGGPNILPAA